MAHSKVQALKREFETLTTKTNVKVDDYSTWFVHVISNLFIKLCIKAKVKCMLIILMVNV